MIPQMIVMFLSLFLLYTSAHGFTRKLLATYSDQDENNITHFVVLQRKNLGEWIRFEKLFTEVCADGTCIMELELDPEIEYVFNAFFKNDVGDGGSVVLNYKTGKIEPVENNPPLMDARYYNNFEAKTLIYGTVTDESHVDVRIMGNENILNFGYPDFFIELDTDEPTSIILEAEDIHGNFSVKTVYDSSLLDFDNYYYLPVFKSQPNYWSGIGITNLSSASPANIDVIVYNQEGAILTIETKTLPASGQEAFLVGMRLSSDGWIKVASDQPLAGLNFLGQYEGTDTNYYMAGVPFSQALSQSQLIAHVAQDSTWDTTVFVANPNTSAATISLTYTDENGTASIPYATSVPANGSKEISVSTVANSNFIQGGSVIISSTRDLTSFALYDNLKTGNYGYVGINSVDTSNVAVSDNYLPVFKSQPNYWSGIGITNLSSTSSANIDVIVYNQEGAILTIETKTLPASGQEAFLVGMRLSSDGWIKVTSDQPLAGLNLLGQYEGLGTNYYMAGVPFSQALSQSLLISHIAQNTTWDTTVFVANPNTSTATISLTYTDENGTASIPYATSIPANGSKEISVSTVANSNFIQGGSVKISSTQRITAFAIYNNIKTGNYSYASINAVDVSSIADDSR